MKAFLPFGNKFDICLEVRTQNGVVKKKKKKSQTLLYLRFQVQFYIIAQTFLLILSLFLTFSPSIFRLLASHLHLSTHHQTLLDRLGLTKLRPITLTPGKKKKVGVALSYFIFSFL